MDYANKGNLRGILTRIIEKVFDIIEKWIFFPYKKKIEEINKELKCKIVEFINAPIEHNNLATETHPQACYRSRLLDFTSKELNEILESEDSQDSSTGITEDLNDCIIKDINN
ncbi:uncharacterized protein OCT59_003666 [Rhizophagus irregularis]|uniref:uncharacterized protein n=1 Tax=Rhizophagus irregularis TaxID=588596 RepID=UPI0033172EAD|nr:hypothetical protein OCT59_003666 [Rhizophagus irregularis]